MSRLIQILNAIKRSEARLELSPAQLRAHVAISEAIQRYGQCNLYGTVLCGKTFLGWRIAREYGSVYLPAPSLLKSACPKSQGIVVDNASERRADYRTVLATVQIRQNIPLLYISRLPVEEDMPQVQLSVTGEDQDTLIRNLQMLNIEVPAVGYSDFWGIIIAAAGGSY